MRSSNLSSSPFPIKLNVNILSVPSLSHVVVTICREITEKHQSLLQMYNKETQANKRLSMDREQLVWRLSQESVVLPPTPSLVSRSVSNPAVNKSAPGTPSLTRRGMHCITPGYRPLSQTDFCTFGPEEFICDDSNDEF